MNRYTWTIAIVLMLAGLVMTFVNRNANQELRPYLGKWSGGFMVTSVAGSEDPELAKRESLTGFVQIYGANSKFLMQLSGEQQEIEVKGTWSLEKETRILLQPTAVAIKDFGGSEQRNPNLVYIPNEAVRATYEKPIVLDLNSEKNHLQGLLTSIGELKGEHQFDRVGSGR